MNPLPSTIEECHQLIRLLLAKVDELSTRLDRLEMENRQLKLENAQLKERLNVSSSNSSLPPSKSLKKHTSNRQPSGKKSGGQPGHTGHNRELLPSDDVDMIAECQLPANCICGGDIIKSPDYVRHQVYELPKLKLPTLSIRFNLASCYTIYLIC
jgi:transposase